MNFAKLLAAGRSIINSGGSVTYRENKSVYLPKFESPKNPFAKGAPAPDPVAVPASAPNSVATKLSVTAPATALPKAPARAASWPGSLNPLARLRGAHSAAVRPVRAEQTELSLDSVRVVGNDLSDAEVDVVPPLKSRPTRKKGQVPAEEWGEVGNGVLGANLV